MDLKPCPHCGGAAVCIYTARGWKAECADRVTSCPVNARSHYKLHKADAIAQWNTRAAPKVKPLVFDEHGEAECFRELIYEVIEDMDEEEEGWIVYFDDECIGEVATKADAYKLANDHRQAAFEAMWEGS